MYKKCSFKLLLVSMLVLFSSCTMITERNSGEVAINLSTSSSRNITDELNGATYTVTLLKTDGTTFDEKTTTSNEVKFTLIPRGDYIIKLVGETSQYYIKGEASVTVIPGVVNEALLPVTYKMKTLNNFTATPTEKGIELFIPSVDKAVTASIECYNTENKKKSFIDINAQNGNFGFVTDYFVQKDKVYNFNVTYLDSNRKTVSSDIIENIKAIGGKGDFVLEVKPVATYTADSSILKFTAMPKIKNNDLETAYEVIYSKIKDGKKYAYSGFISNSEIDFSKVNIWDDGLYGRPVYNPELAATIKLQPNINQYVFFEKEDCANIAQEITVYAPSSAVKYNLIEGKGIELTLPNVVNATKVQIVRENLKTNEITSMWVDNYLQSKNVSDYLVECNTEYCYEIYFEDESGNNIKRSQITLTTPKSTIGEPSYDSTFNVTYDQATSKATFSNASPVTKVFGEKLNAHNGIENLIMEYRLSDMMETNSGTVLYGYVVLDNDNTFDLSKSLDPKGFNKDISLYAFTYCVTMNGINYYFQLPIDSTPGLKEIRKIKVMVISNISPTEKGIEINLKPYWDKYPTAGTIMVSRKNNRFSRKVTDYITVNTIENQQGEIIKDPTVTDYFVNIGDTYSYELDVYDIDMNLLENVSTMPEVTSTNGIGELVIPCPIITDCVSGVQKITSTVPDYSKTNRALETLLGNTKIKQDGSKNYILFGLYYKEDNFIERYLCDDTYKGIFDWKSTYGNQSSHEYSFSAASVRFETDTVIYEHLYRVEETNPDVTSLLEGITRTFTVPQKLVQ